MTKICARCKKEKDSSEFFTRKQAKDGLQYHCIECNRQADGRYKKSDLGRSTVKNWRYSNPAKHLLYAARRRAKRDNLPCTISEEDILIPEFCPALGIKLEGGKGKIGPSPSAPTLDKIDPSLGYVKGNIQVISHKANAMKNNASYDELVKFANWILGGQSDF